MSKRRLFRGMDRPTVIVTVIVLLLGLAYAGVATYIASYYASATPFPSVFSRSGAGLSVWYGYLDRLGLEPKALTSFETLPPGATIIAAGPLGAAPKPGEQERLDAWVRGGGRLVLVGGQLFGLVDEGQLTWKASAAAAASRIAPALPGSLTTGIARIAAGEARFAPGKAAWVANYSDSAGDAIVSRRLGKGEIVWVADPVPVSNDGIGTADNAKLAVLLASVPGRAIYFDEYHQGFVDEATPWDRVGPAGRWAAALVVLGAIALVVALGRRIGPPIAVVEVPAARGGAHIAQLAALYRKAGARAEALEALEDALGRALARRWGTRAGGLARHAGAREALEASAALRARTTIDRDEFLAAARRLRGARQEVEGTHG